MWSRVTLQLPGGGSSQDEAASDPGEADQMETVHHKVLASYFFQNSQNFSLLDVGFPVSYRCGCH